MPSTTPTKKLMPALIFMSAGFSVAHWPSRAAKPRLSRSGTLDTRTQSSRVDLPMGQCSPPRPLGLCIADMQSPRPLENSTYTRNRSNALVQ
jgi:hypothetical protein